MPAKRVHSQCDEIGNELRIYSEAVAPHVLDVRIYIAQERKERRLGIINKKTRALTITRSRSKHLHQKTQSYGFSYMLLSEGKTFDVVILKDETNAYKIPRTQILKQGEFLFFKQQGFEKQIFVPLTILETFSVQEKMF